MLQENIGPSLKVEQFQKHPRVGWVVVVCGRRVRLPVGTVSGREAE